MKVSKYNIYTKLKKQNNKYLIIQGIKGSFDIVDDTIATILKGAEKNELLLDKIPVETIAVLKERGYLVESSEDFVFVERVCKAMNKASRQGINITILPTYNCNFRCEYCFERNLQNKGNKLLSYKMEEKTVDVIFEQIKAYADDGLHIDCIYLFGGEPLLRTNRDIVEYICEKAKKYEIPILCVSNGYDLDKYIDLINYYSFRGVQITIDGIKEHHDSRRFLTGGQGTYNKIIENVEKAIDAGIQITLRTNVNKKNINQIPELLSLYNEKKWTEKENFRYYFKSTIRCYESKQDELSEVELMNILRTYMGDTSENFKYNSIYGSIAKRIEMMLENKSFAPMRSGYCGANAGMYTIDPYGDIYPCWDVLTEEECIIGHINYETQRFEFNDMHDEWKERTVDKLPECKACRYLLFCGGGCTAQAKVIHNDTKRVFCDDFQELFSDVASNVVDDFLEKREQNSDSNLV